MVELKKTLDHIIETDFIDLLYEKPEIYDQLFKGRFGLSDLNISSRVLLHWKEKGLLPVHEDQTFDNDVDEGTHKRRRNKFNFFDLIYIYILQDLRGFGLPLDKLKTIKEKLFAQATVFEDIASLSETELKKAANEGIDESLIVAVKEMKGELSKIVDTNPDLINISILYEAILQVILNKADISLIITTEGNISFRSTNSFGQVQFDTNSHRPHIALPLYNYLYHFLSNKKYKKYYAIYRLLNEKEIYLLEQVRSNMYKEILIKKKSGSQITLEFTEELKNDNSARLQDILLKGEYQELTVKTADGDIKYTTLTTKKRI